MPSSVLPCPASHTPGFALLQLPLLLSQGKQATQMHGRAGVPMSPYRDGREIARLRTHLQQALLNNLGQAGLNRLWAHIQGGICQQVLQAHQRHPHHLRRAHIIPGIMDCHATCTTAASKAAVPRRRIEIDLKRKVSWRSTSFIEQAAWTTCHLLLLSIACQVDKGWSDA